MALAICMRGSISYFQGMLDKSPVLQIFNIEKPCNLLWCIISGNWSSSQATWCRWRWRPCCLPFAETPQTRTKLCHYWAWVPCRCGCCGQMTLLPSRKTIHCGYGPCSLAVAKNSQEFHKSSFSVVLEINYVWSDHTTPERFGKFCSGCFAKITSCAASFHR